jgi:DNA-binding MarR family transcriptional regulator
VLKSRAEPASESEATADELRAVLVAAERFAAAAEARSVALMLKLDVTIAQLRALTTIRRRGRANGRQLSAALRLTPGAVVALCDHLEDRGYVRRVADTDDRRVTWFELTDQGAAALRAPPTAAVAKARMKTLLASLTESEREGFVKVANAFADALESVLGAAADPGAPDPS